MHLGPVARSSPLSAVERLINPPSVVLRVIDDWKLGVGIAQLINLRRVARTDGEPVEVGVRTDILAFVEVADQSAAEDVAAEVDSDLLVQVDVLAVLVHASDAGRGGVAGSISLGCVSSVGRPGEHRQGDCLGDLLEQETIRYSHCC